MPLIGPTSAEGVTPEIQGQLESNVNDVRTPSQAVMDMRTNWHKVTTLLGGTNAMRNAGVTYLPKWRLEEPDDYQYRVKTSVLFNAFAHTVSGLGGKPFTRPVSWSNDMPAEIVEWFENIDLTGRSMHVFAQELFTTALGYGLTHVLTDYPTTEGIQTLAQEKAINARPYLIHVHPEMILGWRSDKSNGVETLTQLRILEHVEVNVGPFAVKTIEQVRVLEPGKWSIWQFDTENEVWKQVNSGVTSMKAIPIITFYTGRTGFMTAESPLIDIADINIQHWQVSSDLYSVLHTASVPILTVTGVEKNDDGTAPLTVAAKSALMLPSGAEAKFVEHSGKAVGSGQTQIDHLEEQMRLLGAEMLVKKPGQATATQATLDTSQQRSELQSLTGVFEDTLNQVIGVMARWGTVAGKPGTMIVYKDFLLAADDAVQEALLFQITTTGMLSQQSFYEAMQRRDVYDTNVTWEMEQERIKSQPLPQAALMPPPQVNPPRTPPSSVAAQLND